MTKPIRPLAEEEKKSESMPGEVSPKDAAVKAREFIAHEKAKLQKNNF